jgi:hypothetical protein
MNRGVIEQLGQISREMKALVAAESDSNDEMSENVSREEHVAGLESDRDELVVGLLFHAY